MKSYRHSVIYFQRFCPKLLNTYGGVTPRSSESIKNATSKKNINRYRSILLPKCLYFKYDSESALNF